MPAPVRSACGAVAIFMFAASIVTASAQQPAAPPAPAAAPSAPASPAPAPAAAPASPAEPSPGALAAADSILTDMGVKRTLSLVVPGMLSELERNVTTTRPEIKAQLREVLRAIQPEFDKNAKDMYDKAMALMVTMLSDKEIEEVATFFKSSGRPKISGRRAPVHAALQRPRRALARADVGRHRDARAAGDEEEGHRLLTGGRTAPARA